MDPIEKRNAQAADAFACQISAQGKVFISWRGRRVRVLKGNEARKFISRMTGLDEQGAQLMMAKVTGNFKRGNER